MGMKQLIELFNHSSSARTAELTSLMLWMQLQLGLQIQLWNRPFKHVRYAPMIMEISQVLTMTPEASNHGSASSHGISINSGSTNDNVTQRLEICSEEMIIQIVSLANISEYHALLCKRMLQSHVRVAIGNAICSVPEVIMRKPFVASDPQKNLCIRI